MALDLAALKAHLNVTTDTDNALLTRTLAAAQAHVAAMIGSVVAGDDVDQAVLMTAAHWYENREATLVGVAAQELPLGVQDIINNHRAYTYG